MFSSFSSRSALAFGKMVADEVGMSQVSGGVEVSPGMVDLASYKEGDVAGEV
jgi:hypothetical protein